MLIAESMEAGEEIFDVLRSAKKLPGLKVKIDKSKVLVSGKKIEAPAPSGQHPCAVRDAVSYLL